MSDMVQKGSKYTDDQRKEAAVLYAVKGSLTAVEKETGIPKTTLSDWKAKEWWDATIYQVRAENEEKQRATFAKIVELANEQVIDRIENGDEVHTKDGIKRIKMGGKELMITGATAYDKLRISLNLPTAITDNSSTRATLQALAQQFCELSESMRVKRVNDDQALEGEYSEAGD